ncbi:hypothetical protein [Blastococcus sp. TF02A-35]|uniref:hypothetical protein n=1 Tax=Blastococcus sp. TF02A-35 TaxID=2559612 RepID=UPI0010735AED|nr:hypothetical protein [Blastococcus sp. TF02A_35]TFV44854.1 hypothetical protein E4P43_18315 [Blastococcus sp. TF02A_35]
MTTTTHHLDLIPLRRAATGQWAEAGCWLDQGIERIVLGCACGWHSRDLTAADLGVAPTAFYGNVEDDEAFTRLTHEMEAAHADAIVPAVLDLGPPVAVEAELLGAR